jgi:hypothetical protein
MVALVRGLVPVHRLEGLDPVGRIRGLGAVGGVDRIGAVVHVDRICGQRAVHPVGLFGTDPDVVAEPPCGDERQEADRLAPPSCRYGSRNSDNR